MWLVLSLISAVCTGSSDAVGKKALESNRYQTVAWGRPTWAAVFLLPLFFFAHAPHAPLQFWRSIILSLPLEVTATLLLHNALKQSDLSSSMPFLAFTPVFILGMAWLFLGESIKVGGVIGVCCVTLGAFFLQHRPTSLKSFISHVFAPRDKASLQMLAVAFLYSLTAVLVKNALLASSGLFFTCTYVSLFGLLMLPFQLMSKPKGQPSISRPTLLVLCGGLDALALLTQFQAFVSTDVAYVMAIKRLSLLLSVLYGWHFFKEKDILSRAVGAFLMVVGSVVLALT